MRPTSTFDRPSTTSHPRPPDDPRTPWLAVIIILVIVSFAVATAVALTIWDDEPATPDVSIDEPDVAVPPADDPATDPGPSTDIRYDEELRANWDVTGVAADDVLNVRELPGADSRIVATLAPDAAEFESTGRIAQVGDQLWREIIVPNDGVGWVNAAYLTETS